MNKNKKIVSLVCAIAMIFTMLSSFTIASAAGEGYTLSTPVLDKAGTTATVVVGYTGLENGLADGRIFLNLPEGVTDVTADPAGADEFDKAAHTYGYSFSYGAKPNLAKSGDIVTLTLKLGDDGLTAPEKISVADGAYLTDASLDANMFEKGNAEFPLAAAEVEVPANPNAPTPKPVTDKTPAPIATDEPVTSDKPVLETPTTAPIGLTFGTPVVNAKDNTVTVDVNYTGMTNGLADGRIFISVPKQVTDITADPAGADEFDKTAHTYGYSFSYGATPNLATSGKIITLTMKYGEAPEYDDQLKVLNGAYLTDASLDANMFEVGTDGVIGSNMVVPAFGGSTDTKKTYDIAMSKAVGSKVDVSDDTLDANGNSKYWIMVSVKNADGTDAEYGEDKDFVAAIGDTTLTKAQYQNLMNGHIGALPAELGITSMKDAVDKLVFKLYTSGSVTAPVVVLADGTILNNEVGAVTAGTAQKTPAPAEASVKVTADKTRISTDGQTKVTATVTHPDAKLASENGVDVTFAITAGADYLELDDSANATVALDSNNQASIRVFAKKAGTATVQATYTYKDKSGEDVTKTGTVKITVSTASVDNSGSDSGKKQTGGQIAMGGQLGNQTGILGTFTDIDDAEWAKEAITLLSLKGIVSGRGDGTFAPNDNITRAEYCQILIGAIEKTNEYADSSFDDVPSDAWFYHAVSVASANGIVSGYGDGNFGPYDLITRQDMALMTYKAAQVMNKNLSAQRTMSFADAGAISAYAATAVQTLADAAIINGVSDTEFAPKANATRAQAAKILYDTFVKAN